MQDMEQVDIIDENNTVLHSTLKTTAHKEGLLHRIIISEIRNSKSQWALVKQAPDRQDPGQYVSPIGGHVQAGESEEDALRREALEECGIKDFTFKRLGQFIFNREVIGRKENHLFIVYVITTDAQIILGDEADDVQWFSTDELKKKLISHPEMFGAAYTVVIKNLLPELQP